MIIGKHKTAPTFRHRSLCHLCLSLLLFGGTMAQAGDDLEASLSNREEAPHAVGCGKVASSKINSRRSFYQWRDEEDRVQFGDKPPIQGYTDLQLKSLRIDSFFNLKVDSSNARLPAFTQDRVTTGVNKIYKTFSKVIQVAELRKIDLNVSFYSDTNKFHAYRKKVAPTTSSKATGFYTPRLNQSVILARGSRDYIVGIGLHEATHAMVAAMFGGAPVWLNEGLAELFETMQMDGSQRYVFKANSRHLRLLKRSSLPTLASHFNQTPREWYSDKNRKLNYATDWSLVYFLMSSQKGIDFLRYMLDNLAVNYCRGFSTVAFVEQSYPGGIAGLEQGWRKWLKQASPGSLSF